MVYPLRTDHQPFANIIYEGESIGIHPNSIDLSAAGVQFNANKPVSAYKILELQLNLPPHLSCPCKQAAQATQTITCSGVVVDCCKNADCGHYHISLFFLDMPETARNHF
ncbi:MAG: hypothetical protein ACI97B_004344, partial [Verrucomicrobiales bacterium]